MRILETISNFFGKFMALIVLAVAALADAACIIMAEGAVLDEAAMKKAKEQEITVMGTELPIFDAALKIHERLSGNQT